MLRARWLPLAPARARALASATLWHNPACSKSRRALELLHERLAPSADGATPATDTRPALTVREYLSEPPTLVELQALAAKLDGQTIDLARTAEPEWPPDLGLEPSDDDVLRAIAATPALLQCPVLELRSSAGVCRPPERVHALLDAENLQTARAMLDPGPVRWPLVAITAAVVVAFAAYIYVERKVDEASPEAPSPPAAAPLPPGAVRRLPDGRLLYDDGSVRRA